MPSFFSFSLLFSYSVFLVCRRRRSRRVELALPDLVTKFTSSTPVRNINKHPVQPAQSAVHDNPAAMEFLMPQLPIPQSATNNRLINGSGSNSSIGHQTSSGTLSVSNKPRQKNNGSSNGSILQSALNSLNSRPSNINVAAIQGPSTDGRRFQQQQLLPPVPTMSTAPSSLYTATVDANATTNRMYQKQTSVSHVTGAMSSMTLQQSATHSASVSSLTTSSTSQTPSVGSATATALMPPPPMAQPKMTKKQLKLAQAQLDKLTQINIHLHGTFSCFTKLFITKHLEFVGSVNSLSCGSYLNKLITDD